MEVKTEGNGLCVETYCPATDGYSAARMRKRWLSQKPRLRGVSLSPPKSCRVATATDRNRPARRTPAGSLSRKGQCMSPAKKNQLCRLLRYVTARWSHPHIREQRKPAYTFGQGMPGLTQLYSPGRGSRAVGICEGADRMMNHITHHRPIAGHGHCVQKALILNNVLQIAGQGRGLLPRQRWVDAYRGQSPRQPWAMHRRRLRWGSPPGSGLRAKLLGRMM